MCAQLSTRRRSSLLATLWLGPGQSATLPGIVPARSLSGSIGALMPGENAGSSNLAGPEGIEPRPRGWRPWYGGRMEGGISTPGRGAPFYFESRRFGTITATAPSCCRCQEEEPYPTSRERSRRRSWPTDALSRRGQDATSHEGQGRPRRRKGDCRSAWARFPGVLAYLRTPPV